MDKIEDLEINTQIPTLTVLEVRNPVWDNEAKTSFTCEVIFAEYESDGFVGFTTSDDTIQGREVFANGLAGKYGKIKEYVRPADHVIRLNLPNLSRRDFRLKAKNLGLTTDKIEEAIESIEDPDKKEDFQIIWEDSQEFGRTEKLLVFLFEYAGISDKDADDMFGGLESVL